MLKPFGDIGGVGTDISLQISSRAVSQLAKIRIKKVIAENQCDKQKKSNLATVSTSHLKTVADIVSP